jgi:lysozyme
MKNLLIIFFLLFSLSSYSQSSLREVEIVSQRKHIDTIQGIDISVYQGKIDWPNIDTNVRFIIIKASEGIARTDNRFKYNWENCNIVKGGYHFFRPQFSGKNQQGRY